MSFPFPLRGGEEPLLRLGTDRIYSFRHRVLDTELGLVHELLAVDVSREYALNRELLEKVSVRLREMLKEEPKNGKSPD